MKLRKLISGITALAMVFTMVTMPTVKAEENVIFETSFDDQPNGEYYVQGAFKGGIKPYTGADMQQGDKIVVTYKVKKANANAADDQGWQGLMGQILVPCYQAPNPEKPEENIVVDYGTEGAQKAYYAPEGFAPIYRYSLMTPDYVEQRLEVTLPALHETLAGDPFQFEFLNLTTQDNENFACYIDDMKIVKITDGSEPVDPTEPPAVEPSDAIVDMTFDGADAKAEDFYKEAWGAPLTATIEANGGVDDSAYVKVTGGSWSNTVSQNFGGVVAGEEYTLSFMFKGSFFNLQIDGDQKEQVEGGVNFDEWTEKTYDFVAKGDSVQFASQNAGGDQCFDNIKIVKKVAVPATEEPATEEPATEEPATEEPATEAPVEEDVTIFEQNFDGDNVDADGKLGGFEAWGVTNKLVDNGDGKALASRGWGAAGLSAWGGEPLEAGANYRLTFKAKGAFAGVAVNLCGDGLGLTNDNGDPANDSVKMDPFTADDWTDMELIFSPKVTGHLVEDPGLMYQILFNPDGNVAAGITVDDIKLEKLGKLPEKTPEPYVEPEGNILYNGIFEDPDGEGPEGVSSGWNDWNCGVFENGMFITNAGGGGTVHTDKFGGAGDEGKKFILRAKVQLLQANATEGQGTGLKLKFNAKGNDATGTLRENEKFVVTLENADFPEGVGSWIEIEKEVAFQTAAECVWNSGDGADNTTTFVADRFEFGFWAHDGQYAIDNISLVPVATYVEPEGNILYNGIFEDPDGDGPEGVTSGWNDWNCGVFENGMFITNAGGGGTVHTDKMGGAGDEGKKFILRAKVQLLQANATEGQGTGLKLKFNAKGNDATGTLRENEKFVVTLENSDFPGGVGSWIEIEQEVAFQTAEECVWNSGEGADNTTTFVADRFEFGFWAHDGQYAIDNISLVPVKDDEPIVSESPKTEDPIVTDDPEEPAPKKKKLAKPVIKKIKSVKKSTVKITLKKKISGAKKFQVKVAKKKSFKGAKKVTVKAKKVFKVKNKLLKKGKKIYFKVKALKTSKKKASKFSKAKLYKIKK